MNGALFIAALIGFPIGLAIMGYALWRQTRTYREAKRFNFDAEVMRKEQRYLDAPKARGERMAALAVGIPAVFIYVATGLVLLLNFHWITLLLIGAALYLAYLPARRIAGLWAARKTVLFHGGDDVKMLHPTLRDSVRNYFTEVWWPSSHYTIEGPRFVFWLGLLVAYVCLWPVTMLIATSGHVRGVQRWEYRLPHWRNYPTQPTQ